MESPDGVCGLILSCLSLSLSAFGNCLQSAFFSCKAPALSLSLSLCIPFNMFSSFDWAFFRYWETLNTYLTEEIFVGSGLLIVPGCRRRKHYKYVVQKN